jgi:hypothetical protein
MKSHLDHSICPQDNLTPFADGEPVELHGKVYTYGAYGLGIHSNFPLPELVEKDSLSDIVIRLGEPAEVSMEAKGVPRWIHATDTEIVIAWEDVGTFRMRNGCEILVVPVPGVTVSLVRLFILGVCLSILLQQRGGAVFHASAVSIDGKGVAFVGSKESGKSTLAAALHSRGHRFLSDDALVMKNGETTPVVFPGFPQIKLWPDSVESALGVGGDCFPRIRSEVEKRSVTASLSFSLNPVPLKCVFLLAGGEAIEIEDLTQREALLRLMPHWYGASINDALLQALGKPRHLLECGKVVNCVPVRLFRRPQLLAGLFDTAHKVEDYLQEVIGQETTL